MKNLKKSLVKGELFKYLEGGQSLQEFMARFIPETWDCDDDLVYSLKLRIDEYTSGYWTEEELKEHLKREI